MSITSRGKVYVDFSPPIRVVIAGTYSKSPAYPNVIGRIELMAEDTRLDVTEAGSPVDLKLDYRNRFWVIWSGACVSVKLGIMSARACKKLFHERARDVAYIPYPAVPVLYLLSFFPESAKPSRVIADAFISIYDTVVNDRKLLSSENFFAGVLHHIERRAFRAATSVVVDTDQNARYYASLLAVDRSRFVHIPLSLHRSVADTLPYVVRHGNRLRVVFVGTMVPLHGIETLCNAILLLPHSCPVDFRLVGNGQESLFVERLLTQLGERSIGDGPRVEWVREWQDMPFVIEEVQAADLCIGILGTGAKTQRVWPYKNYLYMAQGRALVTARTPVAVDIQQHHGLPCFFSVPPGDSVQLAKLIERLCSDRSSLNKVAQAGRMCYDARLSGSRIGTFLFSVLAGGETLK